MSCRKDLGSDLHGNAPATAGVTGRRYWRSLEELCDTEEFRRLIEREFPSQLEVAFDPVNRRKFLTLMGASLALAGVAGCSVKPAPVKEIVPYVRQPEEMIPGKPLYYATAMTLDGAGVGLLVETHLGRPTKIEGNPDHPASRGATSPWHQASVLELYDPDRSQTVRQLGQARTWADAATAIRQVVEQQRGKHGSGLRLLTEAVVSPTLQDQIETLLKQFPEAKWHVYEPVNRDAAYQAATWAFGEPLIPRFDFTRADVVVSLDADFLVAGPGHLRHAGDFMARRRSPTGKSAGRSTNGSLSAGMNRLYVIETAVSCTGAKADHRLAVKHAEIEQLARRLAAAVGVSLGSDAASTESGADDSTAKWIAAVAKDLNAHRGASLVLAGDRQPAAVHLLAHAINDHLGNVAKTVEYIAPIEARPVDRIQSLTELTDACGRGEVECLLVLGGNPVLTAPADIPFVEQLKKVPKRMHVGLYEDETARLCHWHFSEAHFLEAWSDTRAYDGTVSIVQPTIEPLHGGRSMHEVLGMFTDLRDVPGLGIVREMWRRQWQKESSAGDFETRWQTALHDGVIAGSRAAARTVTLNSAWQSHLSNSSPQSSAAGELELLIEPDPAIYDGRFANNGWLQELPKPISKMTWGNAATMSPATAKRLGLKMGEYAHGGEHGGYYMPVIEIRSGDRSLKAPLWILPGHADDTITLTLGYGRQYAGKIGGTPGSPVGVNAYPLRTTKQLWAINNVTVTDTGETELVACTQAHHSMEEREPVRSLTLAEFQKNPHAESGPNENKPSEQGLKLFSAPEHGMARVAPDHATEPPLAMYGPFPDEAPKDKWGMSIDLTSCVGCNACVVACQAENNIPVVGKEQVAKAREMHWIRVDRYISGPPDQPYAFHFQPLPCMHCENAPCEYVCPVAATVHSHDGLNEMIYQRCVGTRFCSNNCPYKVRRFNFLFFADFETPERRMQYNPNVTVRSRGVMEKCSYCVQRIREAQIGAEAAHRTLADGDVLTACQAACPTQAIVFGNMNDSKSAITKAKNSPLDYSLLEDLNTNPRTTYSAELRNPNPELA